jgi:hypothetical protein
MHAESLRIDRRYHALLNPTTALENKLRTDAIKGLLSLACLLPIGTYAQLSDFRAAIKDLKGVSRSGQSDQGGPPTPQPVEASTASGNVGTVNSNVSKAKVSQHNYESWTEGLEPSAVEKPYVLTAALRFEAFSNPCPTATGRCWIPKISLPMVGALPSSGEVHVSYSVGGKPWFVEKFTRKQAQAGLGRNETNIYKFLSERNTYDGQGTRAVGRIDFTVELRDVLANTAKRISQGHFKVGRVSTALGGRAREDFDYYVDKDWAAQYLVIDFFGTRTDIVEYPQLGVSGTFVQKKPQKESFAFHLFLNGKEVASTSSWGHAWATTARHPETQNGYGAMGVRWQLPSVVAYNNPSKPITDALVLSENPGNYTIKIIRNGELVRESGFTVREDGTIDRSLNIAARIPNGYTIVKAKPIGGAEAAAGSGTSDGFWGHPIP